jgi:hypothetical protein
MINILTLKNHALLASSLLILFANPGARGAPAAEAARIAPSAPDKTRSAYDFVNSIGVNTHLNYFDRTYGNFSLVERELESAGIRHVRDGVHFVSSQSDNGVYRRWAKLGGDGIRFDAVLDPRNQLGPLTQEKLEQIDQLTDGAIESFEGPNEMDVSNIGDWASVDRSYQKEIYRSVRLMTDSRSIAVIGPSMASASNGSVLGNIGEWVDYGNLHPYPAAKMPSAVLPDQTQKAEFMFGSKPIMITESGYHNALHDHHDQPAVSESAGAKYITRLFLEDFLHGIARTYLYEFFDEAPEPGLTDLQMHWGLIRSDGSEKPAFSAVKNLIGELRDSTEPKELQQLAYSLNTNNISVHHLLLQKSDGEFDLILWQEVPSYDYQNQTDIAVPQEPVTLTLGRNAVSIRAYEPAAKAEPLQVLFNTARVDLRVPDHPVVVQIAFQ